VFVGGSPELDGEGAYKIATMTEVAGAELRVRGHRERRH
jgi:hypothetical protein